MRTLRVPKGWMLVGTNRTELGEKETRVQADKRRRKFEVTIQNLKKKSYEELQKECLDAERAAEADKIQLQNAYNEGKLQSKRLIEKVEGRTKKRK